MNWILLFIAGLLECAWTVGLKYSRGFSAFWPSLATLAAMFGSVWLLSTAMKTLPMGVAYPVWTGIGIVGAAFLDVVLFGAPVSLPKTICVALILAGIVGLRRFG